MTPSTNRRLEYGITMAPRRIISLLAASLLFHLVLYLLVSLLSRPDLILKKVEKKYIKLHLTQRAEKESQPEISKFSIIKEESKIKTSKEASLQRANKSKGGYVKLLPGPGTFPVFNDSDGEDISKSRRMISFDAKQHAPLKVFAEEIAARIDVPKSLFELQKSGSATVQIARGQDGHWDAKIHKGDAYSKAILQLAFAEIPTNSLGLENLKKVNYDFVELNFNYLTLPTTALDKKARLLKILGNRITLDLYHYEDSKGWTIAKRTIAAVNPTTLGLNILGLGLLAVDSLASKADPRSNYEVLKLRQSPAFTKEIFSIPLK